MAFAHRLWDADMVGFDEKFLPVSEIIKQSKLDYEVGLEKAYLADGTQIPKCQVTRRKDNGTILATVGDRYNVLQNLEAFSFFQPWIDNKIAYIDNVGTLRNGAIIFIQAKVCIDPVEITKGDAVESYINILNSHTGQTSIMPGYFPRRIFCSNQLPALKSSKMLKVKHTVNCQVSLDKIHQIMDVANREFLTTTDDYKFLASKGVSKKDLEKYVKLVFKKESEPAEEETENTRILEKIEFLFESGRGAKETPNTMFKLFNAVNEFLNYESGKSADSRLYSLWNGINFKTNQRALDVAMQMAHGK